MNTAIDYFLKLLQLAVGRNKTLDGPIPVSIWPEIFEIAKTQSLIGVITTVLDELPEDQKAPLAVYARFALACEKIEKMNLIFRDRLRELSSVFSSASIRTCVLKGQAFALYYPQPLRRQCGDIDIWVEGSLKKTVRFVRSKCPVGEVVYHHCDAHFYKDIPVEVHFTPTWMNEFLSDYRLQRWFKDRASAQFGNVDSIMSVAVPGREFSAAFCILHTFRHVIDEGAGLRQLMDCYYLLKVLNSEERSNVGQLMLDLHLGSFCSALMYALNFFFGLPKSCHIVPADKEKGEFLCEEVLISGNMGLWDSRNAHSANENRIHKFIRKTRRQLRFFRLAPVEIMCTPFFKIWQYAWRRINRYF